MVAKKVSFLKRIIGICVIFILIVFVGYLTIPKLAFQVQVENMVLNVGDTFENQFRATFLGKDVTDQVNVQQNVFNTKVGNYEVTYTYHDGNRVYKAVKTIKIKDKITPEITLIGGDEVEIVKGSNYQDAGYYAIDNYDGDVTDAVLVSGEVDVDQVGDYTVTYTVSDSSKNKSKVKRKVIVVDKSSLNEDVCDLELEECDISSKSDK